MKSKKLRKKKTQNLEVNNPQNIQEGDTLIGNRGELYTVGTINIKEDEISLIREGDDADDEYGSYSMTDLNKDYTKLTKTLDEHKNDVCDVIKNGLGFDVEVSKSTDLISADKSKDMEGVRADLEAKQNQVTLMKLMLERTENEMRQVLWKLDEQMKNVKKVISVIQLYLGIDEDIVQLTEGTPAHIETPLTFRQLVLHMDEEVAATHEDGIDFHDMDKFDKWIRKNFKKVMPEEKGVVVCRPRRFKKDYGTDPLTNARMNDGNFTTYVLIRNGNNLYRICNSQTIYPYLFPDENEMLKLHDKMDNDHGFDSEKAEDEILKYKRNVLMLQGLLDRTEILNPKPVGVNLLNPSTYGDMVNFIYDGTGIISDGKLPYTDWLKNINAKLGRGDRIYFLGFDHDDDRDDRMPESGFYHNDNGIPYDLQPPTRTVYNILREEDSDRRYRDEEKRLVFNAMPDSGVYKKGEWRSQPRQKKMTYYVYRDDDIILNYEKIKVEDIDYYMADRVNRRHYMKMMPILKGIKKQLLEEKRWEKNFKELLSTQIEHNLTKKRLDVIMDTAIEWWKQKVIIKRPLKSEDAKALRMIKGRVSKIIKELTTI